MEAGMGSSSIFLSFLPFEISCYVASLGFTFCSFGVLVYLGLPARQRPWFVYERTFWSLRPVSIPSTMAPNFKRCKEANLVWQMTRMKALAAHLPPTEDESSDVAPPLLHSFYIYHLKCLLTFSFLAWCGGLSEAHWSRLQRVITLRALCMEQFGTVSMTEELWRKQTFSLREMADWSIHNVSFI